MKLITLQCKALFWGLMWDLADFWVDLTQSKKAYKAYAHIGNRLFTIEEEIRLHRNR